MRRDADLNEEFRRNAVAFRRRNKNRMVRLKVPEHNGSCELPDESEIMSLWRCYGQLRECVVEDLRAEAKWMSNTLGVLFR